MESSTQTLVFYGLCRGREDRVCDRLKQYIEADKVNRGVRHISTKGQQFTLLTILHKPLTSLKKDYKTNFQYQ